MGYTHYWTQPKDYTAKDWKQIGEDIGAILKDVQHVQGISLALEYDQPGTEPAIEAEIIRFNGLGEDGHEGFYITRKRALENWQTKDRLGWAFCKTARKPYDIAVTAVLCYLASLEKKPWSVSSDGEGRDWLEGVNLARRCVPRLANQIDIPLPIMKHDRWDWRLCRISTQSERYDVRGCLDGHVYVYDVKNESRAYRFPTAEEADSYFATFTEKRIRVDSQWSNGWEGGKGLFGASGCFNAERTAALVRQQDRVLKALIECAPAEGRNIAPPAYARPNEMAGVAREQETLADLYQLCT